MVRGWERLPGGIPPAKAAAVTVLVAVLAAVPAALSAPKTYPDRWVYVSRALTEDAHVDEIRRIVETAADHGLNGLVLAAGYYRLERGDADYVRRLAEVKAICQRRRVEIIPLFFSVGYGGAVLAADRNLAAGIRVRDAVYRVHGSQAQLAADPAVHIENGSFESYQGQQIADVGFHDQPGQVSFVDTQTVKDGKTAVRFEQFTRNEYGHGRLMVEADVKPHRCYRVRVWVKTERLEPAAFRVLVHTPAGRNLAPYDPDIPADSDWREVNVGFNSLEYDKVRIYCGIWDGREGKFWIDDLRIEEVGLVNVLRRPGTPVTVKAADNGRVYAEGRDYEPIADPQLNFRFDRPGPAIRLTPDSRIRDGEGLRVSYYHGIAIHRGQVSVCMSEPKLYEIWARRARLVHEQLHCDKFLLSMDEIRAGGACQACRDRHLSMARILGDCIGRQCRILREVSPNCEIFIWSDMLDPHHNAHDDYYLVEGDFSGSWNYIPRDLVIVCWYYDIREKSLAHFSGLGFATLAGAYYDGDTLDNPRGWLDAIEKTPNARGIMYTTWQDKYELLADFGDLVSQRK